MGDFKFLFQSLSKPFLAGLAALLIVAACSDNPGTSYEDLSSVMDNQTEAYNIAGATSNVVEITARHEGDDYIFELSQDEIPSGWTTFKLKNQSHSTHFAWIAKAPQGAIDGAAENQVPLLDYWVQHVTNPFQFFWDGLVPDKEPNMDDSPTKYAETFFPPWFDDLLPNGGPGFVDGMSTTKTTVYLEEGEYMIECYVKNANNDFHSYLGMIEHLTVSDDNGPGEQETPAYTSEVTVSTNGIDFDRHISAGEHTIKVTFEDQTVYDHLLGHDVHLIRLDRGTSVAEVGKWMNWMDPDGLISSSSANRLGPSTFLGGVQTMTAGSTAYFHVNLKPGRYAWVSEIPDPHSNRMLEVFNVPGPRTVGR